jgi:hypothetical protein
MPFEETREFELHELVAQNEQWQRRLKVVMHMEKWLGANISRYSVEEQYWRTAAQCKQKGKGYLCCHLMLGKAVIPNGSDPLFTDEFFDDVSLWKQLEGKLPDPGQNNFASTKVTEFWNEIRRARDMWSKVVLDAAEVRLLTVNARSTHAVKVLTSRIRETHPKLSEDVVTEHITGLILRYTCIAGFESNQHGSIDPDWSALFPELCECFASPLNHVFDQYFSVFDEDSLFNGRGNFFRNIEQNGGCLPNGGSYEMNPPFEETILNKVAAIVRKTFMQRECTARLVLFVPDWPNTMYVPALRDLLCKMAHHSMQTVAKLKYGHVSRSGLSVKTIVFVFVGKANPESEASDFMSECKKMLESSIDQITLTARFSAMESTIDQLLQSQISHAKSRYQI